MCVYLLLFHDKTAGKILMWYVGCSHRGITIRGRVHRRENREKSDLLWPGHYTYKLYKYYTQVSKTSVTDKVQVHSSHTHVNKITTTLLANVSLLTISEINIR